MISCKEPFIELLHLATLIHDDIIDDSPKRRGTVSIQARFGKDTAVYAGDLLFTGTPAGAGPVAIGDHLEGYVEDRKVLDFNCK